MSPEEKPTIIVRDKEPIGAIVLTEEEKRQAKRNMGLETKNGVLI